MSGTVVAEDLSINEIAKTKRVEMAPNGFLCQESLFSLGLRDKIFG
jgi:hypothetical protein